MKVYVVEAKRFIAYSIGFAILVAVLFIISASNVGVLDVFTLQRDLPIYYVDSKEKKAAITFDCAWGSDDIPQIVDTLKKENVRATFFIVGQWAEKYPDKVKLIAAEGHDIANHGYSHLRMSSIDRGRINQEISLCGQKLSEISGTKVDLFRPPFGDYSDTVVSVARKLGYYTIQWNVDSLDWSPGISQGEILSRISSKLKPGSIILFHNDTPHTAKMLPTIITTLKGKGYDLIPVSQLILRENYKIDYDGKQIKNE